MIFMESLKDALPDIPDESYLMHYGVGLMDGAPGPGSGRYPLGSGEHSNQRMNSFRNVYEELKKKGLSEKDIADSMGMSTTKLRAMISTTSEQQKAENIAIAQELKARGYGATEIGRRMGGVNEATVRGWLKAGERVKKASASATADILKKQIEEKGALDVGKGVEKYLGISQTMLNTAVQQLAEEGYNVYSVQVPQLGMPGKYTTVKTLAAPDISVKDLKKDLTQIKSIEAFSDDCGESFRVAEYPSSISSKRVKVIYAEEGGTNKDGVIELRPGCPDLDLKGSNYAQVRIAVDDTHYLKGMAVYGDPKEFPPGVDVIFNTNKHVGTPMIGEDKNNEVLKRIKSDQDLPFGAVIKADKQYHYIDENGNDRLGAINKVNDEGDWGTWSKSLASQFLSKQSVQLIKQQLDLSYTDKLEHFDSIMKMENPAVRQKLLEDFASKMDSSAVDLKAAAMPRQQSHVLLPIPSLKENEIFAPNYKDGEEVILIRYPHGGIFEIPSLVVNNKNEEARRVIGLNSKDAIGIHPKTAVALSGADFDGDSALVIPNNSHLIKSMTDIMKDPAGAAVVKSLQEFDSKQYRTYPVRETITNSRKQQEMGSVSNLITDMHLKGASIEEIGRAVKHSMVIIDSEKHCLDWQKSERDFGIKELKTKWQGGPNRGASTLISKASAEDRIKEQQIARISKDGTLEKGYTPSKDTGEWLYMETGRKYEQPVRNNRYLSSTDTKPVSGTTYYKKVKDPYTNKMKYEKVKPSAGDDPSKEGWFTKDTSIKINPDGSIVTKTVDALQKTSKMAATKDAFALSSGTIQETYYAKYANDLKALGNRARKEAMNIKPIPADPNAKKVYAKEVASLDAKLNNALKNSPKERQAQIAANVMLKAKRLANPEINDDKDQLKKAKQQSLAIARANVGANKKNVLVEITEKEWEAIQNHAISTTKLKAILANTDMEKVKKYASPKNSALSSAKISVIQAMKRSGYSNADIAERVGCSISTVQKYL